MVTIRRLLFPLMAVFMAGVLLYGTLTETTTLNRSACVIALAGLAASIIAALLLERRVVNRVAKAMDRAMIASLVIFAGATWVLGGGALHGRVEGRNHYLRRDNRETLVTAKEYYTLAGFEVFFLTLVSAGLMFKTRATALKDAS